MLDAHAKEEPAVAATNGEPRAQRVLVAGFGVVGRMVAEQLEDAGVDVTLIELNPRTVETQRRLKRDVIEGSVSDADTLRAAGIEQADALIVAVPDEGHAIEACRVARGLNSKIYIAARANFVSRGILCAEAGADCVIVEEIVTAEAMQKAVMDRLVHGDSGSAECLPTCPRPSPAGAAPAPR